MEAPESAVEPIESAVETAHSAAEAATVTPAATLSDCGEYKKASNNEEVYKSSHKLPPFGMNPAGRLGRQALNSVGRVGLYSSRLR
jgi:hypothetical protein